MSGSPGGLPRSEWLKWLMDVFDPHREAVNNALEDHDERLRTVARAVSAGTEGREALRERVERAEGVLGGLEARVRALEAREPEPGPEPEPEPNPEPDPEPDPHPGELQTINYTPDSSTDFLNPERGWMCRGAGTVITQARQPKSGDNHHAIGYSVVWSEPFGTPWNGSSGNPFRLDNYRTRSLPQSLLTALGDTFAQARASGVKMKVRFSYNYDSSGRDATSERIQSHIAQLSPVLHDNADVIATIDLGFIGAWGELNNSQNLVDSDNPWWVEPWVSARNAVTHALLDATPDWMSVGHRFPLFVRDLFPDYEVDPADRFRTRQSRLGVYNDCFLANRSNGGTFSFDVSERRGHLDRDTFAKIGRFAAVANETCSNGGLNEHNTGPAAVAEMGIMRVDLLFRQFWTPIYDRWRSSGHYDEISRRLGYRLALVQATLPTRIRPGQPFTVELRMRNDGFGKVFNPRPIDLILVGGGQPVTVRLTDDARRDLPLGGQERTLKYTATAPDLAAGAHSARLALPDPARALATDPRYHIRLANSGAWDERTGWHELRAILEATA